MNQLSDQAVMVDKLRVLMALSAAIARQEEVATANPSTGAVAALQALHARRSELQATMRPRLVS